MHHIPELTWTMMNLLLMVVHKSSNKETQLDDLYHNFFHGERRSDCHYTTCQPFPACPEDQMELLNTREGCYRFHEKKYCCKPNHGEATCHYTPCVEGLNNNSYFMTSSVEKHDLKCSENYTEMYRFSEGCRGAGRTNAQRAYCCKDAFLPHCFGVPCHLRKRKDKKVKCPHDYKERGRTTLGCPNKSHEKFQCCSHPHWRDIADIVTNNDTEHSSSSSSNNNKTKTDNSSLEYPQFRIIRTRWNPWKEDESLDNLSSDDLDGAIAITRTENSSSTNKNVPPRWWLAKFRRGAAERSVVSSPRPALLTIGMCLLIFS